MQGGAEGLTLNLSQKGFYVQMNLLVAPFATSHLADVICSDIIFQQEAPPLEFVLRDRPVHSELHHHHTTTECGN